MGRRIGAAIILGFLALGIFPLVRAAEPAPPVALDSPFTPNIRVNSGNPTYLYQVEPTMAINSQGRIFVGWKEAFTHNGGGRRVSFSYSADDGATWAPNVLMPLQTWSMQSDPWLTVTQDDRVFFSRIGYDGTTSPGGIVISETTDGVTWGPNQILDDTPRFADKQAHANDAAGNVYMVWNSDLVVGGLYQLVFSRSNDGGATWTPKVLVPDDTNGHLGGNVRVHPDGTVLATWWSWANVNVWFDRSLDGGVTWGTDVRVNDQVGSADSPLGSDPPVLPALSVGANGTIYVVWEDYRNGYPGGVPNGNMDIMFSRSSDIGATWSPARRLNDDTTTARQWMPDLAIDPFGGIHVAWMDDRLGEHNVYYTNSTDGGTTWGPNVRVTDAGTVLGFNRPGDYLAMESDPWGNIHIAWTDGRSGDLDIYYAKLPKTTSVVVDTNPPGLAVEVDGIPQTAPYTLACQVGSDHVIAVPSPQGGTSTRYRFSSWSDNGAQSHQIRCLSPSTYISSFSTEHAVSLATSPPNLEILFEGVSYSSSQSLWIAEGFEGTVVAPSPQTAGTTRYLFDSWSDDGAQQHSIVVRGPMDLVANFRTQFLLSLQSPYGTVSCDSPDCWYYAETMASFSVSPLVVDDLAGTRHVFDEWTGDSTATTGSATIAMDMPRAVTAAWHAEYELTAVTAHGTVTGAGWYEADAIATFSVSPSVVPGLSGTRYAFAGWSGDSSSTSESASVTMDAPHAVTALWRTEHELTVVSSYGAVSGSGWYPEESLAPFSVSPLVVDGPPGTRYVFDRWTGDSSAPSAVATISMQGPRMVTAVWHIEFELTIVSDHGTLSGAGWYSVEALASFSVSPSTVDGPTGTRYVFARWMGDSEASSNVATLVMEGPRVVTAVWRTEFELTIVSPYGTPTGAGWYPKDAPATVSIDSEVTAAGKTYRFVRWTGDEVRDSVTFNTVMTGPKRIVALWEEVPGTSDLGPPVSAWWPWLLLLAVILFPIILFAWRRRRKEETPPPPTA